MGNILIPSEEMRFFNLVSIDEVGEVFEWHNRIFRGVTNEAKYLVDSYFSSGFIDEIVNKGLFPKTVISDFYSPNYCYIVEHERIDLQSIDAEWSFDMLKDAAILVCDIAAIAWRYGYNMKDCHTKNVLFRNNKPIYVDLGSFVIKEEGTSGFRSYEQIMGYYYYTLKLWTDGCVSLPKQLQALYKFEMRDYLLYRYPFWRHFNNLLNKYVSMQSRLIYLTYADKSSTHIKNSKAISFIWKVVNNVKLFKWQNPESFIKMFEKIKTPLNLKKARFHSRTFLFNENDCSIFNDGKRIFIINPCEYGFLDAFINKFPQKEIVAIDINETTGNANYLKYKSSECCLTNLCFNIFYPTIHYNYQTPPSQRFVADSFIMVNPKDLAHELRKPPFVLFKLLLQYSFERLLVVEDTTASIDDISKEYIDKWYERRCCITNGSFLVNEYFRKL